MDIELLLCLLHLPPACECYHIPHNCLSAGVMLAWLAPPVILNRETLNNVWGMIEWSFNTVIFLLAGQLSTYLSTYQPTYLPTNLPTHLPTYPPICLPTYLLTYLSTYLPTYLPLLSGLIMGNRVISQIIATDVFYCLLFYILLLMVRFLIILMLYPILSTVGHKCSRNEGIFMSWAGLRGVSILIIIITHTHHHHSYSSSLITHTHHHHSYSSSLIIIITTLLQSISYAGIRNCFGANSPPEVSSRRITAIISHDATVSVVHQRPRRLEEGPRSDVLLCQRHW